MKQLFTNFSEDDFKSFMRSIIREELQEFKPKDPDEWLAPKFARQVFKPAVSLMTLDSWSRQGLIKKHYIGKRVFYLRSELIEAAKHLAPYKKKGGHGDEGKK